MESPVRDHNGARDTGRATGDRSERPGALVRELDHRRGDHIDVWLLWRERDDLLYVEVADGRTGEHFAIEVGAGERALDVFRHPYAYAAWRRIDTRAQRSGAITSGR